MPKLPDTLPEFPPGRAPVRRMGPVPGARRSIRRPNRRPVTTKATLEQRRWTVAGLLVGLVLVYGYGFARLVAIGVIQS